MSQKILNSFKILEEYENIHAKWCAELIANGRKTLLSISNIIDNDLLINLMDNFMRFVSLLAQYHPDSSSNEESANKPSDPTLKQQNESQDLLPKNDIIKTMDSDLQCPICNEWLFKATSANCNHTFCETCIKKWLKINKSCPVCRTTIEFTSTSIAVDNFITNLCYLFGGYTKVRRESIMNAHTDVQKETIADFTIDELINSNINQSIEIDTFISQNDTFLTMSHPNMVRLIPCPQTPVSRENSRQPIVSPNTPHPNTVQLLPFPQSSVAPVASPRSNRLQPTSSTHINRLQSTSSTSVFSPRVNRFQPSSPVSIISQRVNRLQPTSPVSVISQRVNRIQPTSVANSNTHRLRTNTNIGSSSSGHH
ncbi:postreplication repair E3 ubiquitin-protein ligase RAD18-like [Melanaphis sacchari]|uniref:E3 ubiquitin-protein ligase RNF8 n=1 Tax=Melanaphis sacchari TaxID=742174 RepID=A0A2H8TLS5_9HEMI|nr:postreplication repair E3 ubiquitin-protein ligase RAD18-like [Melanaphis sacchari]XP_025196326.1 postreplication repair E3 ubiquitin-protein ligase RAD18-like [Melanaphis sacchari]XP_025196327.1 postreplication repair E3 ubiquitin-protein ligase RAD18-like [Melanaphis sacchari]XP_025196328.1 postreplication repair E3 ubiquitin-protein ligase RAD18-like [Melanaphis sacchari]